MHTAFSTGATLHTYEGLEIVLYNGFSVKVLDNYSRLSNLVFLYPALFGRRCPEEEYIHTYETKSFIHKFKAVNGH